MPHHKARRHFWEDGQLKTIDYFFNTLEQAKNFIDSVIKTTPVEQGHEFKIIDHHGTVVYSTPGLISDLYA